MPDLKLDLDTNAWSLSERILFERVTGRTADEALAMFANIEDVPEDSDEIPEGFLRIPASVFAGFAFIAARRSEPGITFDEVTERYSQRDILDAMPGEDDAPLAPPNRATRRSSAKSSARSATPTTTRPPKSEA